MSSVKEPKMPSSIRVGYRNFTVENWDGNVAHAMDYYGTNNFKTATIKVSEDLDPEKKANTLLHEVLHACYSIGYLDDGADEEAVVESVSNTLCQVWQDNPDFITYMTKALKVRK